MHLVRSSDTEVVMSAEARELCTDLGRDHLQIIFTFCCCSTPGLATDTLYNFLLKTFSIDTSYKTSDRHSKEMVG